MTPTSHDDALDPVHDPAIDRAWQATRSEEPSAALDDLIRAAARREVGARPRAQPVRFRSWMPFAAAATVAVVAFGIVQMAPPEMVSTQVASMPSPSVAERGAALPSPAATAEKSAGFNNAPPEASAAATAKIEARASDAVSAGGSPPQPRQRSVAEATAKPQAAPAMQDAQRSTAAVPVARPAPPFSPAPALQSAATDRAAPAAMSTAPPAMPPAAASHATTDSLVRRSEPFPATEAPKRVDAIPRPAPAPAQAPGASPALDRTAQAAGRLAKDAAPPARDSRASEADAAASGGAARADVAQYESSPPQSAGKREVGGAASAQAAPVKTASTDAPLQAPAARTLDDWITLLRRLKAEGRDEQLTRELVAFRALYKDRANDLLPADLRDLKR